ncbi:MAG: hypothetical protein Q9159_003374 [Coniocarpon cinnabarinum]
MNTTVIRGASTRFPTPPTSEDLSIPSEDGDEVSLASVATTEPPPSADSNDSPSSMYYSPLTSFDASPNSSSPLRDVKWVNVLDHAIDRAIASRSPRGFWHGKLEDCVDAWCEGRLDLVRIYTDYAFQNYLCFTFFQELAFSILHHRVCHGDNASAIRLLEDYQGVFRDCWNKFSDLDRQAVAFFRQIIRLPDTKLRAELAACLGIPR